MPRLDQISVPEKICDGCWLINEIGINNIYLIEGEKSALLIDAGYGMGDTVGYLRQFTDKPITVALTHFHTDHSCGARLFGSFYTHKKDVTLYGRAMNTNRIYKRYCQYLGLDIHQPDKRAKLNKFGDNHVFDLGNVHVEAVPFPGHSRGSVLFVDHEHKLMFGGDNSNLQLWMDIPGGVSLEDWFNATEKVLDYMDKGYTLYGAHGPGMRTRQELETNRNFVREIMEMKRSGQLKSRRGIYPSKVDRQHVRYKSRRILSRKL